MELPITLGSLAMFIGPSDPAGGLWMVADGRAISRTVYAPYFALVGTTFGPGDGSTTFNIPNIQKRIIGRSVAAPYIVLVRLPLECSSSEATAPCGKADVPA
jgi:microcystin-dependent protein